MSEKASHSHSHSASAHSHNHDHLPVNDAVMLFMGENIFSFSPALNSLLAVIIITFLTQVLILYAPPFHGRALSFLVSFAGGGMLGTIFLHLIPEITFTRDCGLVMITGFLSFVALEKVLQMFGSSEHSHSHSHNLDTNAKHVHEDKHEHDTAQSSSVKSSSDNARSRGKKGKKEHKTTEISKKEHKSSKNTNEENSSFNITPWLNVIADSMHNVTDGMSLAVSFKKSTSVGITAFMLMCCHEIPHQFGDFALLISSGTSKSTARKAQLVTALGTLTGCLLGSNLGSFSVTLEKSIDEFAMPFTAGVFLYVVTIGVIPEIMESESTTLKSKIYDFVVMITGLWCGVLLLLKLD